MNQLDPDVRITAFAKPFGNLADQECGQKIVPASKIITFPLREGFRKGDEVNGVRDGLRVVSFENIQ